MGFISLAQLTPDTMGHGEILIKLSYTCGVTEKEIKGIITSDIFPLNVPLNTLRG